ncbi:NUDIX domain-containing protein [Paenibacillus lycopersici]|uniref:NUDIX domain-containing protein n=1 Tax=Paenibacillus lycopersici TaxID=2704462 RepID=A0A6C0G5L1_9BACL|nr:NUDIX domain-containing protein [Paenibacillus lycopersici]QHT62400.1 NUDIX domain-containing protein [Paenibacillus lycopersici]
MNRPLLRAEVILVRRDGQAVLVQCDRDETFYRFPGGSVEFGETAAEAIRRELMEEFELHADIDGLACLSESIVEYDGKQRHDCTILHWGSIADEDGNAVYDHREVDGIQLIWRTLEQLEHKDVYPEGIRDVINRRAESAEHIVVRKNYDEA